MRGSARVRLVAGREIRERVRTRSFRVATVIAVVAVVAAITAPTLIDDDVDVYDVALVAPTSLHLERTVAAAGPLVGARVRLHAASNETAAVIQVRDGTVDVAVIGGREILVDQAPAADDTDGKARLVGFLSSTLGSLRSLEQAGLSPDAAATALRSPPLDVRGLEEEDDATPRVATFFGILVLFVFLQQYGNWILIGVLEEKMSRVVEVLLAAVRPQELLAGKVLGIGAVAFVQAALVLGGALGAAAVTGSNVLEGTSLTGITSVFAWFVLGYAFYAWAYAAIGATVSRQDEAMNAQFPLSVPLMVAYISAVSVIGGGETSTLVRVLAFLPPTAPMIMPMLVASGDAGLVESVVAGGLTVAGAVVLMRLSGRVYVRSILHTTGRLRLREALRAPALVRD